MTELHKQRYSPEKINEIAVGIVRGEILTDRQLPANSLSDVFVALKLIGRTTVKQLAEHPPSLMFGYMKEAGPISVNGYPMFFTVHFAFEEDTKLIIEKVKALAAAWDEILKDKKT